MSNKTYRSTKSKHMEKLCIKVITTSELKFFVDTFFATHCINDLLRVTRSVLGNMKPDLFCTARACVKVMTSHFWYGASNPVSKSFINGIIIFKIKTTFLQDLQIVWYVVLMSTNRLSGIKVSEKKTG